MIVETKDLDEAYQAYVDKKIMRETLFLIIINNIKADRDKLQALREDLARQSALLGSMSAELADTKRQVVAAVNDVDMRVAMAANAALSIWSKMQDGGGDPTASAKRGPGRPPLKAVE